MCHFSLMGAKVVKSWQLAVISCQFLGDVLGACIIIGFQFYNLTYPPKINNEENSDDSKMKFLDKMNNNDSQRTSEKYIINRISVDSN